MSRISRRKLLACTPPALAALALSYSASAFPVPRDPSPMPKGTWPEVATGWVDLDPDFFRHALIGEAMGGVACLASQFQDGALAAGFHDNGSELAQVRIRYLDSALRKALVGATGPDGFRSITKPPLSASAITKAAAELSAPPGYAFQEYCNSWAGQIVSRWNRLAPITQQPAMTDDQRAVFFNYHLKKATTRLEFEGNRTKRLSSEGRRAFWGGLPENASWEFAHLALRSWRQYGVP